MSGSEVALATTARSQIWRAFSGCQLRSWLLLLQPGEEGGQRAPEQIAVG